MWTHGTSSSRFHVNSWCHHLGNRRWRSRRRCFRGQNTIGSTREKLSSCFSTGSRLGNHLIHIWRRTSCRRGSRSGRTCAEAPPCTCGGGTGPSLSLLLLSLLGHFRLLGLQQFPRNAAGIVLRIEEQLPQLPTKDGRLLLAQKRREVDLRQLGVDRSRRCPILRHRWQEQIHRHALNDLILQPPRKAVMRSSIHCVRMARWTRVVSTLREKLGGNLVDRTSFVRARSSAMEPVPLMVGMAVYLLYFVRSARRLWTVSDLFNTST